MNVPSGDHAQRDADGSRPGAELLGLASEHGGVPVEVRRVSRLEAPRHRGAAYRIRFADGSLAKGRELRDEAAALRIEYVLRHARHAAFPRLLARRGAAVLLEWIDGAPLERDACSEPVLREAADFLADVHRTPVPAGPPFPPAAPEDAVSRQTARTTRHLGQLVQAGVLGEERAEALRHTLEALRPVRWQVGFVHGDLCAENLVVDATGRLRVVDNESLGLDACDADLARTLYRWPLDRRGSRILLDGYAKRRSVEPLLEHFGYWSLAARLGSAAHRIGAPAAVAREPLASLERLLAAIEAGFRGEELLARSSIGP